MSSSLRYSISMLTIATTLLASSGSASAEVRLRSFVQNTTGACQPALPVFDGQIRKRPLAVQNEGTAAAFISCSFMGTDLAAAGILGVLLLSDNSNTAAVTLTCTLVTGASGGVTGQRFLPQTITMPASSRLNRFRWFAADFGLGNLDNVTSASCNLPVGTGLSLAVIYYSEDVGA